LAFHRKAGCSTRCDALLSDLEEVGVVASKVLEEFRVFVYPPKVADLSVKWGFSLVFPSLKQRHQGLDKPLKNGCYKGSYRKNPEVRA